MQNLPIVIYKPCLNYQERILISTKKIEAGFHAVRRSARYWTGLSTYLIIEQVLMRSVKKYGCLTRGRGMTEIQRLVWVLSMPVCANVNEAMQKLTGVSYQTSEHHKYIYIDGQAS